MAEEPLREIIDAMRTRIEAELEAQITALTARHDEAIAQARQDAEAQAEQRWGSRVDAVRAEWSARLESEIAAARAESETRLVEEATRVRTEADERLASESMRVKSEAEQALAAERQRAAAELDAERQRAAAELDAERQRAEQDLQQTLGALAVEQEQLEQEVRSRRAESAGPGSILEAARAISDATSLSDALSQLLRGAAAHAPRAALFVVNDARLDEWPVAGIPPLAQRPVEPDQGGLLSAAVRAGSPLAAIDGDAERSAPGFTLLPPGRWAVAVPLIVGGRAVAVLYADEGTADGEHGGSGSAEAVELLGRHAAACLAHLTAVRSMQLQHGGNGHEAAGAPPPPDDDRSARRYAKLLISEIKLYNEGAVRVGCQKRDLLQRLKAEIDRARRLYEERVPATVDARQSYFHEELIHTLAGGDPAALGS